MLAGLGLTAFTAAAGEQHILQHLRTIGHDAVDAEVEQARSSSGSSDRPDVDVVTAAVGAGDGARRDDHDPADPDRGATCRRKHQAACTGPKLEHRRSPKAARKRRKR